ncbi:putative Casein kinase II subunit alpha [Blattamonas nauphoetae]|uniref:non-specific serine/threonine protein kinase n=1 Tax=Blattamonas nauphoetae TaxID=2049346 RepID=A0ABQ9YLV8_9EUKA|nr:putative Casein kinase II subunit alpha [Blattamonas nauphoetae]
MSGEVDIETEQVEFSQLEREEIIQFSNAVYLDELDSNLFDFYLHERLCLIESHIALVLRSKKTYDHDHSTIRAWIQRLEEIINSTNEDDLMRPPPVGSDLFDELDSTKLNVSQTQTPIRPIMKTSIPLSIPHSTHSEQSTLLTPVRPSSILGQDDQMISSMNHLSTTKLTSFGYSIQRALEFCLENLQHFDERYSSLDFIHQFKLRSTIFEEIRLLFDLMYTCIQCDIYCPLGTDYASWIVFTRDFIKSLGALITNVSIPDSTEHHNAEHYLTDAQHFSTICFHAIVGLIQGLRFPSHSTLDLVNSATQPKSLSPHSEISRSNTPFSFVSSTTFQSVNTRSGQSSVVYDELPHQFTDSQSIQRINSVMFQWLMKSDDNSVRVSISTTHGQTQEVSFSSLITPIVMGWSSCLLYADSRNLFDSDHSESGSPFENDFVLKTSLERRQESKQNQTATQFLTHCFPHHPFNLLHLFVLNEKHSSTINLHQTIQAHINDAFSSTIFDFLGWVVSTITSTKPLLKTPLTLPAFPSSSQINSSLNQSSTFLDSILSHESIPIQFSQSTEQLISLVTNLNQSFSSSLPQSEELATLTSSLFKGNESLAQQFWYLNTSGREPVQAQIASSFPVSPSSFLDFLTSLASSHCQGDIIDMLNQLRTLTFSLPLLPLLKEGTFHLSNSQPPHLLFTLTRNLTVNRTTLLPSTVGEIKTVNDESSFKQSATTKQALDSLQDVELLYQPLLQQMTGMTVEIQFLIPKGSNGWKHIVEPLFNLKQQAFHSHQTISILNSTLDFFDAFIGEEGDWTTSLNQTLSQFIPTDQTNRPSKNGIPSSLFILMKNTFSTLAGFLSATHHPNTTSMLLLTASKTLNILSRTLPYSTIIESDFTTISVGAKLILSSSFIHSDLTTLLQSFTTFCEAGLTLISHGSASASPDLSPDALDPIVEVLVQDVLPNVQSSSVLLLTEIYSILSLIFHFLPPDLDLNASISQRPFPDGTIPRLSIFDSPSSHFRFVIANILSTDRLTFSFVMNTVAWLGEEEWKECKSRMEASSIELGPSQSNPKVTALIQALDVISGFLECCENTVICDQEKQIPQTDISSLMHSVLSIFTSHSLTLAQTHGTTQFISFISQLLCSNNDSIVNSVASSRASNLCNGFETRINVVDSLFSSSTLTASTSITLGIDLDSAEEHSQWEQMVGLMIRELGKMSPPNLLSIEKELDELTKQTLAELCRNSSIAILNSILSSQLLSLDDLPTIFTTIQDVTPVLSTIVEELVNTSSYHPLVETVCRLFGFQLSDCRTLQKKLSQADLVFTSPESFGFDIHTALLPILISQVKPSRREFLGQAARTIEIELTKNDQTTMQTRCSVIQKLCEIQTAVIRSFKMEQLHSASNIFSLTAHFHKLIDSTSSLSEQIVPAPPLLFSLSLLRSNTVLINSILVTESLNITLPSLLLSSSALMFIIPDPPRNNPFTALFCHTLDDEIHLATLQDESDQRPSLLSSNLLQSQILLPSQSTPYSDLFHVKEVIEDSDEDDDAWGRIDDTPAPADLMENDSQLLVKSSHDPRARINVLRPFGLRRLNHLLRLCSMAQNDPQKSEFLTVALVMISVAVEKIPLTNRFMWSRGCGKPITEFDLKVTLASDKGEVVQKFLGVIWRIIDHARQSLCQFLVHPITEDQLNDFLTSDFNHSFLLVVFAIGSISSLLQAHSAFGPLLTLSTVLSLLSITIKLLLSPLTIKVQNRLSHPPNPSFIGSVSSTTNARQLSFPQSQARNDHVTFSFLEWCVWKKDALVIDCCKEIMKALVGCCMWKCEQGMEEPRIEQIINNESGPSPLMPCSVLLSAFLSSLVNNTPSRRQALVNIRTPNLNLLTIQRKEELDFSFGGSPINITSGDRTQTPIKRCTALVQNALTPVKGRREPELYLSTPKTGKQTHHNSMIEEAWTIQKENRAIVSSNVYISQQNTKPDETIIQTPPALSFNSDKSRKTETVITTKLLSDLSKQDIGTIQNQLVVIDSQRDESDQFLSPALFHAIIFTLPQIVSNFSSKSRIEAKSLLDNLRFLSALTHSLYSMLEGSIDEYFERIVTDSPETNKITSVPSMSPSRQKDSEGTPLHHSGSMTGESIETGLSPGSGMMSKFGRSWKFHSGGGLSIEAGRERLIVDTTKINQMVELWVNVEKGESGKGESRDGETDDTEKNKNSSLSSFGTPMLGKRINSSLSESDTVDADDSSFDASIRLLEGVVLCGEMIVENMKILVWGVNGLRSVPQVAATRPYWNDLGWVGELSDELLKLCTWIQRDIRGMDEIGGRVERLEGMLGGLLKRDCDQTDARMSANPNHSPKSQSWKSSVARVYPDALKQFPDEFSDPETVQIVPNSCEPYELIKKIGHGKFGEVFEGIDIRNGRMCAVKVLRPIRKKKLQREVKILGCLDQGPNIVSLYDIVRDAESKMFGFIFEEIDNDDFRELYPKLQPFEVRYYLYQILKSLDFAHSRGIMHRDIKPHNIMIDHSQHKLRVIDWGLAEFYRPGTEYNVRVASRHYKGPELLTNLRCYDYSLDIWSLGCVLAAIMFQKTPFFRGRDDEDQLVKITQVLGSDALFQYVRKYELNVQLTGKLVDQPKKDWSTFITDASAHLCTPDALDLLDRMLRFDHQERLTCKEAMNHPFFAEVRLFDNPQLSCGREISPLPALLALEMEQKTEGGVEKRKQDNYIELDYLDRVEYAHKMMSEKPLSELLQTYLEDSRGNLPSQSPSTRMHDRPVDSGDVAEDSDEDHNDPSSL